MIFDYTAEGFREWRCGQAEIHGWPLGTEGHREVWAARLVMEGKILVQVERCSFWWRGSDQAGDELVSMLVSQAEYADRALSSLRFTIPWSAEALDAIADAEFNHPPGWYDHDHAEAVRRLLEFRRSSRYFLASLNDWLASVLDDDQAHPHSHQETHYLVKETA